MYPVKRVLVTGMRHYYSSQLQPCFNKHFDDWLKPNSITLAGSELVRSWFEVKFHYAIWFEPASNQVQTSSELASNQLRTS